MAIIRPVAAVNAPSMTLGVSCGCLGILFPDGDIVAVSNDSVGHSGIAIHGQSNYGGVSAHCSGRRFGRRRVLKNGFFRAS